MMKPSIHDEAVVDAANQGLSFSALLEQMALSSAFCLSLCLFSSGLPLFILLGASLNSRIK